MAVTNEGDRGYTSFVLLILELNLVVWVGYYSDRNAGNAVKELEVILVTSELSTTGHSENWVVCSTALLASSATKLRSSCSPEGSEAGGTALSPSLRNLKLLRARQGFLRTAGAFSPYCACLPKWLLAGHQR